MILHQQRICNCDTELRLLNHWFSHGPFGFCAYNFQEWTLPSGSLDPSLHTQVPPIPFCKNMMLLIVNIPVTPWLGSKAAIIPEYEHLEEKLPRGSQHQ